MTTTLASIIETFDSDEPGSFRKALLLAREVGLREELAAVLAARRAEAALDAAVARQIDEVVYRQTLSTAALEADADADSPAGRYARELLRLDTIDQRRDAWRLAHRFLNATADAGRPSDALRSGVNEILAA